jgi:hypothetical protein
MTELTKKEREQVAEILKRRANEIAGYQSDLRNKQDLASVDFALEREIKRLRNLADKVNPPDTDDDD